MTVQRKSMKTEARRTFNCGFALAEGELRRLHDVLVQQIRRTSVADDYHASYELKYRNGSVAYPGSLDEVLEQENFGSAAIVRLWMDVSGPDENPTNRISVEFANAEDEDDEPVKYRVTGEDRDWVFVTSSQLEERIGKIKLFAPNQLFTRGSRIWVTFLPLALVMFVGLLFINFTSHHRHTQSLKQLDSIGREWKAGVIRDPADLAIQSGRVIIDEVDAQGTAPMWVPFAMVVVIVCLPLLSYCYIYFQPLYNFLWGDYVAIYETRRSRGRFLVVGILLTLVLGILINFLSKRIGI